MIAEQADSLGDRERPLPWRARKDFLEKYKDLLRRNPPQSSGKRTRAAIAAVANAQYASGEALSTGAKAIGC
jgi:hypothetical protein